MEQMRRLMGQWWVHAEVSKLVYIIVVIETFWSMNWSAMNFAHEILSQYIIYLSFYLYNTKIKFYVYIFWISIKETVIEKRGKIL